MTIGKWVATRKGFAITSTAVAIGVIWFAKVHPIGPPSAWADWSSGNVAEWLGWIGLFALWLALFQIVRTISVAEQVRTSVTEAMNQVGKIDHAVGIRGATDSLLETIRLIRNDDFEQAAIECDAALMLLQPALASRATLGPANAAVLDTVVLQVGSANMAIEAAVAEPPPAPEKLNVIGTLRQQRLSLARLSQRLRTTL